MKHKNVLILACVLGLSTPHLPAAADGSNAQFSSQASFSHRPDDSFELGLSGGLILVVGRKGEVRSFQTGAAKLHQNKSGQPLQVRSPSGQLLCSLVYSPSGQLRAIHSTQDGTFKLAYSKNKNLIRWSFPNGQQEVFAEHDR
jgi:YD repeat-containing protein